jgi:hypothetical protein
VSGATLLKLAKSVGDPNISAALVEKAADFKSQVDELSPEPDQSPGLLMSRPKSNGCGKPRSSNTYFTALPEMR